MFFQCHICTKKNDRYHTVWLPDRDEKRNEVYPICFDCCDSICSFLAKEVLQQIQIRNLTGKTVL